RGRVCRRLRGHRRRAPRCPGRSRPPPAGRTPRPPDRGPRGPPTPTGCRAGPAAAAGRRSARQPGVGRTTRGFAASPRWGVPQSSGLSAEATLSDSSGESASAEPTSGVSSSTAADEFALSGTSSAVSADSTPEPAAPGSSGDVPAAAVVVGPRSPSVGFTTSISSDVSLGVVSTPPRNMTGGGGGGVPPAVTLNTPATAITPAARAASRRYLRIGSSVYAPDRPPEGPVETGASFSHLSRPRRGCPPRPGSAPKRGTAPAPGSDREPGA